VPSEHPSESSERSAHFGEVNGEGSGGVWFAVGATGKLVKSAPSSATTATTGSGF
jgi:hypothetical protein